MPSLQKINLGTPPSGVDGDTVRAALAKVNSNSDVLAACVALGYKFLSDNSTLTLGDVGTRFGLNMGVGGKVVKLPLASSVSVNACVHFFNVGPPVTIGFQGNDGSQIKQLNTGDWATYIADGGTWWHVAERGRMLWDETVGGNLTVGGALTVAGGVAGDLAARGKLVGTNSPNLLLNGSAEIGVVGGWGPYGFVEAYTGGTAEGTYFSNKAAISTSSFVGSSPIAIGANVPLTLSGEIHAGGVTAGTVWFRMVYLNASGGVIGTSPNITTTNGYGWSYKSDSRTTPAGTASVYVQLGVEGSPPAVVVGGVSWRRLKLEYGSAPSLYSQEATIAYLGGAPAFAGRPTFGGNVPWDSGNLPRPLQHSDIGAIAAAGGETRDLSISFEPRLALNFIPKANSVFATASLYINIGQHPAVANDFIAYLTVFDVAANTQVAGGTSSIISVPNGSLYVGLSSAGSLTCSVAHSSLVIGKQYQVLLYVRKVQPVGPVYPAGMSINGIVA
ncbi:hypothetical protein [Burkholderia cepacia]|uniref:hypothetical protein n=1 Tax=Burkholderia cepacia TaxID=292 RepID=UPI000A54D31E|nr:hypothetical protein [Burkholderia cepacia]